MADPAAFTFKINDMVQFKDGRANTRVGFVQAQKEPDDEHNVRGYDILFKINETGQNRLAWWAETGLMAATPPAPKFKKGDAVVIGDGEQSGEVYQAEPISLGQLEPRYAVLFKGTNGMIDLAWWGESMVSAAS